MRSAVGGWVLNHLDSPPPRTALSGFSMKSWLVAGLTRIGIRSVAAEIFSRAPASTMGRPVISAPSWSASNSLEREMANLINMAAIGAITSEMMTPMAPSGLSRLFPPPNQNAILTIIEMAAASIAAIELIVAGATFEPIDAVTAAYGVVSLLTPDHVVTVVA